MAENKGNYRHGMYGTPMIPYFLALKMDIAEAIDYLRGVKTYRRT